MVGAVAFIVVDLERALPAAPPQRQRLISFVAKQPGRRLDQYTEDRRAIIIGKLYQPGFDDEPAKLDQLTGPFAPFHLPGPRVSSRPACL